MAVAGLLLAGCSGDTPDDPAALPTVAPAGTTSAATPAASATPASRGPVSVELDGGSSAAARDVLPAFEGFLTDMAAAMAKPDDPPRSRWATTSGQVLIDNRAKSLAKADRRVTGPISVTARIQVTGRTASVTGCLDQSKVTTERAGKPATLDEPKRLKVQSILRGSGTRWQVVSFSVPKGQTC